MTRLQATAVMRERVQAMKAKGALRLPVAVEQTTQRLSRDIKPKRQKGGSAATKKPVATGEPHPERVMKAAGGVRESMTPPFHRRVEAPYQKYAAQLQQAEVIALDTLYEMGVRALNNAHARLTQSYDGMRIDLPYRAFQHMTVQERTVFESFNDVWKQLGPGFHYIAINSVFEIPPPGQERALTVSELGAYISGYRDERRAIGAGVCAMRLLAWRVLEILGHFKKSKKAKKRT